MGSQACHLAPCSLVKKKIESWVCTSIDGGIKATRARRERAEGIFRDDRGSDRDPKVTPTYRKKWLRWHNDYQVSRKYGLGVVMSWLAIKRVGVLGHAFANHSFKEAKIFCQREVNRNCDRVTSPDFDREIPTSIFREARSENSWRSFPLFSRSRSVSQVFIYILYATIIKKVKYVSTQMSIRKKWCLKEYEL